MLNINEEERDYVYVRDWDGTDERIVFIRLAKLGEVKSVSSFDTLCSVDVDEDGNVVGVMIQWQK